MTVSEQKYVHYRFHVDGKFTNKLVARHHAWQDDTTKLWNIGFNGKRVICTETSHGRALRCDIHLKSLAGYTIEELFTELGKRFAKLTETS
jgi:hypothetical protein